MRIITGTEESCNVSYNGGAEENCCRSNINLTKYNPFNIANVYLYSGRPTFSIATGIILKDIRRTKYSQSYRII